MLCLIRIDWQIVFLYIRNNGTNIASTVISRVLSVGVGSIYSGSTIVTLAAGDVIDMAVSALLAVGVTLGSGVNATLSVKKLNKNSKFFTELNIIQIARE